ncbi:hypothetical protein QQP08_014976 [Theobroma cacao]|nr:hypothetical protein QQP08_014976 [Theobroma cacao]
MGPTRNTDPDGTITVDASTLQAAAHAATNAWFAMKQSFSLNDFDIKIYNMLRMGCKMVITDCCSRERTTVETHDQFPSRESLLHV